MGDFTIIRGDTCYITYIKLDEDGNQIDLLPGDSCTFSAKKQLKQLTFDIQVISTTIENGQIIIKLVQNDTNIALGEYYYDIQLNEDITGDTFTVSRGILTIDWDVTANE